MLKTKKAPVMGYSLKGIKVFQGMDGVGLNATLLRDGKPICTLIDEGCGGMMFFRWHDQMHGESKEKNLFDAFVATEKEKTDDVKKDEYGHTERFYFNDEQWVNTTVERQENEKRMKRLCKTKTCYQVGPGIGSEKFYTVKGVDSETREWIQKRHPGSIIKFLNDDVKE